ncbi:MAG: ABC transporter substrate-binding protein [Acidobacteriota bacterium]
MSHAPLHIAAEEGYFADRNLDVEFVRLGRHQEVMAALAQGNVDVATGLLTVNELNLIAGGARIRLVAAMGEVSPDHCPHMAFMIRREHLESGATADPERIRRFRVDVDILSPFGYWLHELLKPRGMTLETLDLVDLPSPTAVDAMARGSIDVVVDSEPWVSMHTASDDVAIWKPVGELLPGYVFNMVMYGPDLLDERPEVGERFATAVLQGIRQYNRGKTGRNLAIVQAATGLSAEQVATSCWAKMRVDARIDPSVFRGYQEWLLARGLVERMIADEELVDQRFIDHGNDVLAR